MSKVMTIRPPDKLKQALQKNAKCKGLTLNALVLQILWDYISTDTKAG